jgi:mannose-1-phosphate guanylyltransferase/mannose-6-phosphate isomerase
MKNIILAGGIGKRTWDLINFPKQFFIIQDGFSCFIMTIFRALEICKSKDIIITINKEYLEVAINQCNQFFPNIYHDFIFIVESESKNTLSSIFYSLLFLKKNDNLDYQIIINPCDHIIENLIIYKNDVNKIFQQNNKINFLCVQPFEINDQYGHIILNKENKKIEKFIEKPSFERIKNFIESNELFYWNSGIYVVNGGFLFDLLEDFLNFSEKKSKKIKNEFLPIEKLFFIDKIIEDLMPNISIDLFLQKNINLECCSAYQINFDWLDIGCPKKLAYFMHNNLRVCSSAG